MKLLKKGLRSEVYDLENILLTPTGPVLVDWADVCTGNPAGDVARAWILIRTPYADVGMPGWAKRHFGCSKTQVVPKLYKRICSHHRDKQSLMHGLAGTDGSGPLERMCTE